MGWLALAWGIAQLIALFSGNFLLFLMMVLIDAVWFLGWNVARMAAQREATTPLALTDSARPVSTGFVAEPSSPALVSAEASDWDDVLGEMMEVVEFHPRDDDSDGYGWSHFNVDFARMEYDSSGGVDEVSTSTEGLLRRTDSGWEMKELWTTHSCAGEKDWSETPVDEVNEEFGLGTQDWDPELEAQYHRRVAKALTWRKVPPGPFADQIETAYRRALHFFQGHPGIYPRMKKEDCARIGPNAEVWKPRSHPENAVPERFGIGCADGPDKGAWFPLRARGLLLVGGASACDWQLHNPAGLARQFQLKVDDEAVLLRDLGGGTRINGAVTAERQLAPDDTISFGTTVLKVYERRSIPKEVRPSPYKKAASDLDAWGEKHPEALKALIDLNRRSEAELKPLSTAHAERVRPLKEQRDRALTAAKAAYDDMVRPYSEEFERTTKPLYAAYGKADRDLADEASQPFREKYFRSIEPARQMLRDAEHAAKEIYESQVHPLEEAHRRETQPIMERVATERRALFDSTKE